MAFNMFRRTADQIRTRDPSGDGFRRALRAAIAIPLAALVSFLVSGYSQTAVFTLVGSIALLIAADFPGDVGTRALAYGSLGLNGALLITLGTWAAPHPWLAIPLCFLIGAMVSFLGLLSDVIAAGQRATLMTFLLPVCMPVGGWLDDRLLGWALALVVCVPLALFLFPPHETTRLRDNAARVCTALADRIEGGEDAVTPAMDALRTEFRGSAARPVILTAGGRSLIRVVSNLTWLSDRVGPDTGVLLGAIGPAGVEVLRASAEVLLSGERDDATRLAGIVAGHRRTAFEVYTAYIDDIFDEPDDATALRRGQELLDRRTMSATIGLTGSIIAAATIVDTRSLMDRLFGRGLPETGIADRVGTHRSAVLSLSGYLKTRSITVINSLRTGLALAMAVAIALLLPVQNGMWVALGALSVLRSSASITRTTAMRALAGTTIGFVVGASLIAVIGVNPVMLWILLPLTTFGSTYVLTVGSFTASQAMFTMQVLIVFNLMRPTGWQVGLTRIEDVLIGAGVGLVVSGLLWPGGAQAAVRRAIGGAVAACSDYLSAAVVRVTRGTSPQTSAALAGLDADSLTATRTYGDAVRVYLAETNGAIDPAVLDSPGRIPRLRTTADMIADVTPPPPGVFAKTRALLEERTQALCARLRHDEPATEVAGIAEEFLATLRSEARASGAAPEAALPLVTTAANIGELEMTYPPVNEETEAAVG